LSAVIDEIQEEGDGVVLTSHYAVTFTSDFNLSAMGAGVLPTTGRAVVFSPNTVRVRFGGDRIARVHTQDIGPDAGMPGFVKALV
jgi:hypothetical protein